MSLNKAKRAARKGLSVGLTATTTLWLAGSSLIVAVPAAHALGNEAVVTDITGDNPRIAADGESERVMLGLNLARTDNTDTVQMQSLRVGLSSDDGGDAESALANIETVRFYRDSSLSGTNGVFDSNDSLVHSVTRTEAGAVSGTLHAVTASTVTCMELSAAVAEAALAIGDFVKVGAGTTSEIADVTGVFDAAGCGTVTGAANLSFSVTALSAVPAVSSAWREVNNETAAATEGFQAFATGTVELGDTTADAGAMTGAYDIPKTDTGSEAGDDGFLVLLTAGGVAAETIKAQIFGATAIQYENVTILTSTVAVSVSTGTNTTDGETKAVEFGADGDAPSISKVETYDNDKDGRVDRVKVFFDESMAAIETGTANFMDALGGTPSEINGLGGNDDDIDLMVTGTWSTTTVLNDTLQVDFTGDTDNPDDGETDTEYNNAVNSTGDQWTVIYDEDGGADVMRDATGEALLDTNIQTTDKARPEMMAAVLKDNDGDDAIDSLEVTWSEQLAVASDSSGYTLTNTTENPDVNSTLGAVTSRIKSDGADANTADTLVIAVTELSDDVNDVFQLDYTASATTTDLASNEGNSETNMATTVDVEPRIEKVEYRDATADGQIDSALITFTRAIDVDATWENEFSFSGGYVFAATGDTDNTTQLTINITGLGSADTDAKPQLTYTKPAGDLADICISNADDDCEPTTDAATDTPLENVVSADVVEEDDAAPVLLSATFYDGDDDGVWDSGETFQLLFSEGVDAAQIASGWNVAGATGNTAWVDWQFQTAGDAALADNVIPDSGTISVSGRVVTLTATASATVAIGGTDEIDLVANEIKDFAGNSAVVNLGGLIDLALTLNPAAPAPVNIWTRDTNGNGKLDAIEIEFGGMIESTSINMSEFAAARGSNNFAGTNVTPDLTITSVVTVNGIDDTRVLVRFGEANEGTDALPMVKYVASATLQDLAGNDIDSFNQYAADDTKFVSPIPGASDSTDGADPQVVLKRLRDRNTNGIYDQLVLVFSEDMDSTVLATDGWVVSDHSLASAGVWTGNDGTYDAYTFVNVENVFSTDILESMAPTVLPTVVYGSTGAFRDDVGRVLGDEAGGGELSDIAVMPGASVDDGELFMLTGDGAVWIAKHVGAKKFRRHVLWGDFDVIYPHLAPMWPVQSVNQATYNMYTLSAWIRVAGTAPVYEVNDDATAHHLTCDDNAVAGQDCANEWVAAGGDPDGIFEINGAGGEWSRLTVTNPVVLPDQVT